MLVVDGCELPEAQREDDATGAKKQELQGHLKTSEAGRESFRYDQVDCRAIKPRRARQGGMVAANIEWKRRL